MEGGAKVFQIVGYKNSGKTTLIQDIIHHWNGYNRRVGIIKHHGHGGAPATQIKDFDTDKHLRAGGAYAAVEGNGELLLQNKGSKWSLQDIIQIYTTFSLDLILIEGYKKEHYPKIVIIQNKADLSLLLELTNIQAVLSWISIHNSQMYPVFSIKDKPDLLRWLYSTLQHKP